MLSKKEIFKLVTDEAAKSPAKRRKVGAILLNQCDEVVGRGYNHLADNLTACCENEAGDTLIGVRHAEANCLDYAFKAGSTVKGLTMYVSHEPCVDCRTLLASCNVNYEVVEEFLKFDGDKARYDLVPPSAIQGMADVLTFGARKYKPNNWKNCEDPERYVAAYMRHLEAYRNGEELDKDSGLPHLAHAMTNLAFLLELGFVPKDWTK